MNVNLLSVSQLCDDRFTVVFTLIKAHVIKQNKIIMSAPQNQNNGTWVYNFNENNDENAQTLPLMNNIYKIMKATELVKCLHAASGFPVTDIWVKAICNN